MLYFDVIARYLLMRLSTTILFISLVSAISAQPLAIINDPDGFTNVRKGPGTTYEVVGKLVENEVFMLSDELQPDNEWYMVFQVEFPYAEGYVHKSRIQLLSKLPKVEDKSYDKGELRMSNQNIDFMITRKDFDRSAHEYEMDGPHVRKIDGFEPFGIDGDYPTSEIVSMSLSINRKPVELPTDAYSDLFNVNFGQIEIRLKSDDTLFVIMASNSDGAGGYDAVWVVIDKEYHKRHIVQI